MARPGFAALSCAFAGTATKSGAHASTMGIKLCVIVILSIASSRSLGERRIEKPAALREIVEHHLQLAHMLRRRAGSNPGRDRGPRATFIPGLLRLLPLTIELVGSVIGRAVGRHRCRLRRPGLPDILHELLA